MGYLNLLFKHNFLGSYLLLHIAQINRLALCQPKVDLIFASIAHIQICIVDCFYLSIYISHQAFFAVAAMGKAQVVAKFV